MKFRNQLHKNWKLITMWRLNNMLLKQLMGQRSNQYRNQNNLEKYEMDLM